LSHAETSRITSCAAHTDNRPKERFTRWRCSRRPAVGATRDDRLALRRCFSCIVRLCCVCQRSFAFIRGSTAPQSAKIGADRRSSAFPRGTKQQRDPTLFRGVSVVRLRLGSLSSALQIGEQVG
jgi:hypothetical protein